VTDKQGNIIKQFQNEKFNNLVHFSVSENGKEIYLLNNLQIYKIDL
jgi:ERCC4-related helicase